jgi:hypothetical protein
MQQSTFFNLLLQFALFSFAMAEETLKAQGHGNTWQYGAGGGVLGFIVLILDIIVWSMSFLIPHSIDRRSFPCSPYSLSRCRDKRREQLAL